MVMQGELPRIQTRNSLTLTPIVITYTVPAGLFFQVRDGILVSGGHFVINGRVTGNPSGYGQFHWNLYPQWQLSPKAQV